MLARISEFARILRQNRVRVSTGELLDAVAAAQAVGLDDAAGFRAALAATLCKRPGDRRVFDELFSLCFMRGRDLLRGPEAPLPSLLAELGLDPAEIAALLDAIAEDAARMSAAGRAGLGYGQRDVAELLRAAGATLDGVRMSSPLQVGYQAYRVLNALDLDRAERELAALVASARQALGEQAAAALAEAARRNLTALRAAVRRFVQEEFERQNVDFVSEFRARTLAERPLSLLSEEEIGRLRVEVQRLARKLRTQASLRPRRRRRGRLDLRRTLRRSLATGGVPVDLRWQRRRPDRPRLVVLCDISDSVRNVSRFMLELVYTLQELFERVRSFVFVADLGEVTDAFRQQQIEAAVRLAYEGAIINVAANSDYGRALGQFAARHLDAITSRTTVIVIGDARSNYNPPNVDALAELRRRAKRLIWLNPEPPAAWGFGDSAMRDYEPHCDRVVVAQNLESLRKVVDGLVL